MKRKMDFYEVQRLNEGCLIHDTEGGFEVYDKKLSINFEIPTETDVLFDGSLFNPIRLLAVPADLAGLVLPDALDSPIFMQCLCGRVKITDTNGVMGVRFVPGIALDEIAQTNAVLLRAHWDVQDGVWDSGWKELVDALYDFAYAKAVTDDYCMSGDWYWILRFDSSCLPLRALVAHYYSTMDTVLAGARVAMAEFERNKEHYAAMINEIIGPLRSSGTWGSFSANTDATTARKYETTDEMVFRHDAIGLKTCAQEFQWAMKEELLAEERMRELMGELSKETD